MVEMMFRQHIAAKSPQFVGFRNCGEFCTQRCDMAPFFVPRVVRSCLAVGISPMRYRNYSLLTALVHLVWLTQCSHAGVLGFDIQLTFSGLTTSQQAVFQSAAQAWESRLIGYQDTVASNIVQINATGITIDGAGGILGSAGPTFGKVGTELRYLYAAQGDMQFDSADLAGLQSSGLLYDVILHEMAHVLGIGTLWSSSAVGVPGFQELYVSGTGQYTGANALAAWRAEFNQPSATFVPVELGGGSGTADAHWNEVNGGGSNTGFVSNITGRDFRFELMTGWLDGPTYISSVTMGSFQDLGYMVSVPEPASMVMATASVAVCIALIRRSRLPSRNPPV